MPPQSISVWHNDYFQLIILRNCRHLEALKESSNYPFVREIYTRKGAYNQEGSYYQRSLTFLPEKLAPRQAGPIFAYQTFPLLTFQQIARSPLKPQGPIPFLKSGL